MALFALLLKLKLDFLNINVLLMERFQMFESLSLLTLALVFFHLSLGNILILLHYLV